MYALITTIFQEKYRKFVPFQNGGQMTDFQFASFRFQQEIENNNNNSSSNNNNNTFLNEFFIEISLKLEDHEYIYIAEIKFG